MKLTSHEDQATEFYKISYAFVYTSRQKHQIQRASTYQMSSKDPLGEKVLKRNKSASSVVEDHHHQFRHSDTASESVSKIILDMVEPIMQWVLGSILSIELFKLYLVPASVPQPVQQMLSYVLSCLWDGVFKKILCC